MEGVIDGVKGPLNGAKAMVSVVSDFLDNVGYFVLASGQCPREPQ